MVSFSHTFIIQTSARLFCLFLVYFNSMNKSSLLLLCLFFISGCISIPGEEDRSSYYSVQHTGYAIVTRLFQYQNIAYLDFTWHSDNNSGNPDEITRLAIENIVDIDLSADLKVGDKLLLEVTHFFLQNNSSTPSLLESVWFYKNREQGNNPILLMPGKTYRPPRCLNQ